MEDVEWMSAPAAAAPLGVSTGHVAWLAARGELVAERRSRGRWWVRRDSVQQLAEDRASWMSWDEAVTLVGCPRSRIARAVRDGDLESRAHRGTKQPSLRRASVEAFALVWAEQRRVELERRRERLSERPTRSAPDDSHVWLTTAEAALVVGLTRNGLRYRASHGLLPHVNQSGRLWFRRDHVEQAAAARAFRARYQRGPI